MSDDIINNKTEAVRKFTTIASVLGGLGMIDGLNRIMDGLCPDCGEVDHGERCFEEIEPKKDESK